LEVFGQFVQGKIRLRLQSRRSAYAIVGTQTSVRVFYEKTGESAENQLDISQVFIHNGFVKKPKRSDKMTTFTVKNIPTDIYSLLKQSAATNRRSINSEIIVCIEKAVSSRQIEVAMLLARAREIRRKTRDYLLTEDEITKAKLEGRP